MRGQIRGDGRRPDTLFPHQITVLKDVCKSVRDDDEANKRTIWAHISERKKDL